MELISNRFLGHTSGLAESCIAQFVPAQAEEFDWSAYLDFSEDETHSEPSTTLEEDPKVPSFEGFMPHYSAGASTNGEDQFEQSAQRLVSPISSTSCELASVAVSNGGYELNLNIRYPDSSTAFINPDSSPTLQSVEFEERHDPDGLAGVFGLTLEQAQQGVRIPLKRKKEVELTRLATLCQPAGVHKQKSMPKKPAAFRHNWCYSGLSTSEQLLAVQLEAEIERMNAQAKVLNPPSEVNSDIPTPKTANDAYHRYLQHQAQRRSQLTEKQQMQSVPQPIQSPGQIRQNQQLQSTRHIQPPRQAQLIQQLHSTQYAQPSQQCNSLQWQTQIILARQQIIQRSSQSSTQMDTGYGAATAQSQPMLAKQPYPQNRSNGQNHAHPQDQHTASYNHQQGRIPINHGYPSPVSQLDRSSPQQTPNLFPTGQVENRYNPQIFCAMPAHAVNGSRHMRGPEQQQPLLVHQIQAPGFQQQETYNLNFDQYQTRSSAIHVTMAAPYETAQNGGTSQQRVSHLLTPQQQQWFHYLTQGRR